MTRLCYEAEPHPHLRVDAIVDDAVYAEMRFPDDLIEPGAGWGLTSTDPAYRTVLDDPQWGTLIRMLRSEAFIGTVLDAFAGDMRQHGCLVDLDNVQIVDLDESRDEKHAAVLRADGDPNALFTRVDFQSHSATTYRDFIHLDWARRVVGGILFFSDAVEADLEGGDLAFYRDRAFQNDRWCHDPELVARFSPKHNTGVIFLNTNAAFHGPTRITRLSGRRRWLYYTISSAADVWPCAPRAT